MVARPGVRSSKDLADQEEMGIKLQKRRLVIIESPYSGEIERNKSYLRRCRLDSIRRGEAPLASHHSYTDILDDTKQEERTIGMLCGFSWMTVAELVAVYEDYGISHGMREGIAMAERLGIPHEFRRIGQNELPVHPDSGE